MKLFNIVICICLVTYAVCQDEIGSGAESPAEDEGGSSPSSPGSSDPDSTVKATDQPETSSPEVSSSEGPTVFPGDSTSNPDSSPAETASPEVSSSGDSTTGTEDVTTIFDIDTGNDTIITLTNTPDENVTDTSATDETNSTTVYDDDDTAFNTTFTPTVTPVDGGDISGNNKSVCSENPCKNGGICKEESSPPFSCECPTGYVGIRCQTTDNCVNDQDGEICKNGFCAYSKNGLVRFCDCFVGHYWDNVTGECREKITACDSNPCGNGGVCNLLPHDTYNCTCEIGFSGKACEVTELCHADDDCGHGVCILSGDKKKTRSCKCDDGFYLEEQSGPHTCREITAPCDSNPCKNGGECNSFQDKYNCTCETGFSGKVCEVTDWCVADQDCGQGVCVLSEEKKTRSCKCNEGFYLEKQNHTCKKISNICHPNPCLHDGICTFLPPNDYNCTCSEGYKGKKCGIRDMCIMDGGNAYCRNGTCENNHDLGIYYCTCSDDLYFHYTQRTCAEVDLCPLMKCPNTEKCSHGNCECKDNYERNNKTQNCEPNFCASQPCPIPDMKCEEGTDITDYKCSCQEGYTFNGTHCNEASCVFPHLNPCSQLCSMTESGYECSCDEDFQLKEDNHTCELIGNNTCSNKTCDKGSCVQKSDMEVCICPPGYVEVDGKCTDICSAAKISPGICPSDECETKPEGGFRCKCEGKFAFSEDKTTCVVRNMCQENEIGSKICRERNAAQCVHNWNRTEGFECECTNGQIKTEDGTCRDVCSIESNQRYCSQKGAACDVDKTGKVMCRCPPYFRADETDGKCNKPADVSYLITLPLDRSTYARGNRKQRSLDTPIDYQKIFRDVKITIEEMFADFTGANVLYCNTTSGYLLCKIELQFKTEYEIQLRRLETEDICLTNDNSKNCLLPPALVLVKERISQDVIIEPTNPCEEYIKEEICGSETSCTSSLSEKSFNCSCKAGFMVRKKSYPFGNSNSFVESCKDIDECVEDDPCPPNSNCLNTLGSYFCTCKSGFRSDKDSPGSKDEKCVEICNPNPCTHGVCSRRGDHYFDCKCDAGYRGAFCDLQDENFKRARVNTIIVGVVLGGILLITFILFAVRVSRMRKRKCLENPGQMFYSSTEMKERGRINNAFQRD